MKSSLMKNICCNVIQPRRGCVVGILYKPPRVLPVAIKIQALQAWYVLIDFPWVETQGY